MYHLQCIRLHVNPLGAIWSQFGTISINRFRKDSRFVFGELGDLLLKKVGGDCFNCRWFFQQKFRLTKIALHIFCSLQKEVTNILLNVPFKLLWLSPPVFVVMFNKTRINLDMGCAHVDTAGGTVSLGGSLMSNSVDTTLVIPSTNTWMFSPWLFVLVPPKCWGQAPRWYKYFLIRNFLIEISWL